MKALLDWIDKHGGIGDVLIELGIGLFFLICLVRCAAE